MEDDCSVSGNKGNQGKMEGLEGEGNARKIVKRGKWGWGDKVRDKGIGGGKGDGSGTKKGIGGGREKKIGREAGVEDVTATSPSLWVLK